MSGIRRLNEELVEREAEKKKLPLRVFVGGPFIKPNNVRAPKRAVYGGAAMLRFKIYNRIIDQYDYDVSIGENTDLQNLYKGIFEELYDASTMEFAHIRDYCDALILIPSSPGSFCELGYFCASNGISRKLLVLLDDKHSKRPGYVHVGPAAQAHLHGAVIQTVKYLDVEQVWKVVCDFLDLMRVRKFAEQYRME